MSKKTAVILFNLGGPDRPEAVEPFLFNLFSDPAIIGAPWPIRWWLARRISRKRAPHARQIYAHLGGKSPLLEQTQAQARELERELGNGFRCFIAMRYWHPFALEAAEAAKAWGADRAMLLPLYPQFSTTTSGSSFRDWSRQAAKARLNVPTQAICCYPDEEGLIAALARLTAKGMDQASEGGKPRVLFSAHGLPKKIIDKGDPYQAQVELTASRVAGRLGLGEADWVVCYQSRVGPLEWIGPSTEEELERAGRDRVPVVVVPIAFVSEHSETLVELDIEYRQLARELKIPAYVRVPALGCEPDFIKGLAGLIKTGGDDTGRTCQHLGRKCPC